jgi:hypothetical protein
MPDTPMRLNGANGNVDKTGLVTFVVSYEVYSLLDAITYAPKEQGVNLPIVGRNFTETEIGNWKLDLTYQGLHAEPPKDDSAIEVELDGSMSQDPLKSNPNWSEINAEYGPWGKQPDGTTGFPEFLEGDGASDNAHGGGEASKNKPNPGYGVESWLVAEAVFRVKMTVRVVPPSIMEGVGLPVSTPPYWHLLGVPVPKGRDFLKLIPKIQVKGNAKSVTMEFKMSGPRGVDKLIYKQAQLGGHSSGGGGLSTGSLITGSL